MGPCPAPGLADFSVRTPSLQVRLSTKLPGRVCFHSKDQPGLSGGLHPSLASWPRAPLLSDTWRQCHPLQEPRRPSHQPKSPQRSPAPTSLLCASPEVQLLLGHGLFPSITSHSQTRVQFQGMAGPPFPPGLKLATSDSHSSGQTQQ